jgi:hypothetical protein
MVAVDNSVSVSGPATFAAPVTPSDSADLAFVTRSLYVGGAGNVTVVMYDQGSAAAVGGGNEKAVTLTGLTAGQFLPLRVSKVLATGTTATLLVALW